MVTTILVGKNQVERHIWLLGLQYFLSFEFELPFFCNLDACVLLTWVQVAYKCNPLFRSYKHQLKLPWEMQNFICRWGNQHSLTRVTLFWFWVLAFYMSFIIGYWVFKNKILVLIFYAILIIGPHISKLKILALIFYTILIIGPQISKLKILAWALDS